MADQVAKLCIKRAVPDDRAALFAILDTAYRPFRDQGLALPDMSDGLEEEIALGLVWVAEDAGQPDDGPLGILMVSLMPPVAHLVNVALAPEAQGKGVGGALIRHAIELATDAGCARIDLATHRDLTENVGLYEHLGWRVTERVGMKIVMSRPLTKDQT